MTVSNVAVPVTGVLTFASGSVAATAVLAPFFTGVALILIFSILLLILATYACLS